MKRHFRGARPRRMRVGRVSLAELSTTQFIALKNVVVAGGGPPGDASVCAPRGAQSIDAATVASRTETDHIAPSRSSVTGSFREPSR